MESYVWLAHRSRPGWSWLVDERPWRIARQKSDFILESILLFFLESRSLNL